MAQIARDYKDGIFVPALDLSGGLQDGTLVVQGTPAADGNPVAVLPSGATPWLQAPYGICATSGFVGGTGTVAGEALTVKRQGLGRVKVTNGNAIARGQLFGADAAVLGNVVPYVAGSFSGWVMGTFEETKAASTTDDLAECFISPYYVADLEGITVSQPLSTTPIGAVTVFGASTGLAFSATGVPLYVVRFTGENIRNLLVNLAVAPGGTDTVIAAVVKSSDGGKTYTAPVGGPTCTITGAGLTASDLVNQYVATKGDVIGIRFISSAGIAAGCSASFDAS